MTEQRPDGAEPEPRAEPVVRPRGMRAHSAEVVRRARIYADGKSLVVRDPRLRERRYPVGGGDITRAVFVPPSPDLWETVAKRPAERWGTLVFEQEDGRGVLQVPLAEWLPEAHVVGVLELRPERCLDRTGLRELAAELGIPLEESTQPRGNGSVATDRGSGSDRAVHGELPRWYGWTRGLGVFGWFLALVVAFAADVDWCLPLAAGALFLVPASDALVRLGAWWRNRRDLRTRFAGAVVITPDPAAGERVTRRFCRTASVRVVSGDVVLTDTVGRERWLARGGAYGIARMVRLVAPGAGRQPLGVELRDRNGESRALLPWRHWFAGPRGQDRWNELVAGLSVPVADEEVRSPGRRAETMEPWWKGHSLAADARMMSPLPAKEARAETSWHRTVVGGNELLLVPLFSLVLLAGLFGDSVVARLAGLFSLLTIVAELGPAAVASLISRSSSDKPVEHGQDQ
jgi:hypothetical protein